MIISIKSRDNGGLYFHPIIIFIMGVLFFYILPMIYFNDINVISFFILILGCVSYFFGFYVFKKIKVNFYKQENIKNKWVVRIIIALFSLYTVYELFKVGSYSDYAELFNERSQTEIYSQLLIKISYVFILLSVALFSSESKKKYIISSFAFCFYNLMSPTRLDFVFAVIFCMLLGVYFSYITIRFKHFLLGVISVPLLFSFLLIKRLVSYSGESFFSSFSLLIKNSNLEYILSNSIVSLETFYTYLTMQDIIRDNIIEPASGVIRIFFLFIPRTIWEDKPEAMSRIVAKIYFPEAYYNGGGFVGGIFGDAYLNAGILGIVIFWFILGGLSKVIYSSLILSIDQCSNYGKAYFITLYMVFIIYFIQCLRGFGSDQLWIYIYQTILIIILMKLIYKK